MISDASISDDFMLVDSVVDDPLDFVQEEHLCDGRRLAGTRGMQLHHRRRQLFSLMRNHAEFVGVINAMF